MISDYICGSSYLGLALESPAAEEHDVMEMDAAAYTVFWVPTQHVPEADAGLKYFHINPIVCEGWVCDHAGIPANIVRTMMMIRFISRCIYRQRERLPYWIR